jgi:hypothetical protein
MLLPIMGNTIKCSHTYHCMDTLEVNVPVNSFKYISLLLSKAHPTEFSKFVTYGKKSCVKCDNIIYYKQNEHEPWEWGRLRNKPECFNK